MKYKISDQQEMDMGELEAPFFLVGLLNEFMNRFQAEGDRIFEEISWKQGFLLNCISFFPEPPVLKELADFMGTSHQNVKQMLLKLEKQGFVTLLPDEHDKRKQRILLTEKMAQFQKEKDEPSRRFMEQLFGEISPDDLETTVRTILRLDEQLKKRKYI